MYFIEKLQMKSYRNSSLLLLIIILIIFCAILLYIMQHNSSITCMKNLDDSALTLEFEKKFSKNGYDVRNVKIVSHEQDYIETKRTDVPTYRFYIIFQIDDSTKNTESIGNGLWIR